MCICTPPLYFNWFFVFLWMNYIRARFFWTNNARLYFYLGHTVTKYLATIFSSTRTSSRGCWRSTTHPVCLLERHWRIKSNRAWLRICLCWWMYWTRTREKSSCWPKRSGLLSNSKSNVRVGRSGNGPKVLITKTKTCSMQREGRTLRGLDISKWTRMDVWVIIDTIVEVSCRILRVYSPVFKN